jgi:hypothetical protein
MLSPSAINGPYPRDVGTLRRARCTARRTRNTHRRMTSTRSPRISFVIASSAICSRDFFVPKVPSAICSTKCRCHDYETAPNRVSPSGVLPPVKGWRRPSHERTENVPGICSRLHPHSAIDGCKGPRDFAKNGSGVGRSGERSRAVREEGGRRAVKREPVVLPTSARNALGFAFRGNRRGQKIGTGDRAHHHGAPPFPRFGRDEPLHWKHSAAGGFAGPQKSPGRCRGLVCRRDLSEISNGPRRERRSRRSRQSGSSGEPDPYRHPGGCAPSRRKAVRSE